MRSWVSVILLCLLFSSCNNLGDATSVISEKNEFSNSWDNIPLVTNTKTNYDDIPSEPNNNYDDLEVKKKYIVELDELSPLELALKNKNNLNKISVNSLSSKAIKKVVSQQNEVVSDIKSLDSKSNNKVISKTVGNLLSVETSISKKSLETLPGVKAVYPDLEVHAYMMEANPIIQAPDVWEDYGFTGEGVIVAVIDTGVDYTHDALGDCLGTECKVIGGYDVGNDDTDPMDDHGHGTHVAGTIAGKKTIIPKPDIDVIPQQAIGDVVYKNSYYLGVAPEAKILAYKSLSESGSGYHSWIIAAMEQAFLDGADIVSMSLGGEGNPEDLLSQKVDELSDAGVIFVIAAGNSGPNEQTIGSPGVARSAITIGATFDDYFEPFYWACNPGDRTSCGTCPDSGQVYCDYWGADETTPEMVTPFSSRGPVVEGDLYLNKPDVVAPGALICAPRYDSIFPEGMHPYYKPCLDGSYLEMAGTSMATPVVSGIIALLLEKYPDLSPLEVKSMVQNTAVDIDEVVENAGYGLVNAYDLLSSEKLLFSIDNEGIISGSPTITITGQIYLPEQKNATIWYKERDENNWEIACLLTNIPIGEIYSYSCDWDVSLLPDDNYALKLSTDDGYTESFVVLRNVYIFNPANFYDSSKPLGYNTPWSGNNDPIYLYGNAIITNFSNYTITYFGPQENYLEMRFYHNPPVGGFLGEMFPINWGISGIYKIVLTVNSNTLPSRSYEHYIYLDYDLFPNWPYINNYPEEREPLFDGYESLWQSRRSVLVNDLNGDNIDEIISLVRINNEIKAIYSDLDYETFSSYSEGYHPYSIENFFSVGPDSVVLFQDRYPELNELYKITFSNNEILWDNNLVSNKGFIPYADFSGDGSPDFVLTRGDNFKLIDSVGNTIAGYPYFEELDNQYFGMPIDYDSEGVWDWLGINDYQSYDYETSEVIVINGSYQILTNWSFPKFKTMYKVISLKNPAGIKRIIVGGWPLGDFYNGGFEDGLRVFDYEGNQVCSIGGNRAVDDVVVGQMFGGGDLELVISSFRYDYELNRWFWELLVTDIDCNILLTSSVDYYEDYGKLLLVNLDEDIYDEIITSETDRNLPGSNILLLDNDLSLMKKLYVGSNIPQYMIGNFDFDAELELFAQTPCDTFTLENCGGYLWDLNIDDSNPSWPMFEHDNRYTFNYNSQCSRDVYVGDCQAEKPLYCGVNQEIVNNCEICGCDDGLVCKTDGSCARPVKPPVEIPQKAIVG